MNLLETLTRAADEEQLRLRPLPTHAAAAQQEHLRNHYALLLAAVLTAQPAVSEPQTRLLRMLLDALQLGDIRGQLFEQARDLTPEPLLEAARLIREAGFAQHLVLDVLVLLRLDSPMTDDAVRLVGELATFLNLNDADLVTRAADAAHILGLSASLPNQTGSEEHEGNEPEADASVPSSTELWPSQLSQHLTAEALRAGLQGGLWRLDANLDVDFPWQATNARLYFTNGATLNTWAKEGAIKLTDCRLFDVALDFQGACSIALEHCDWLGNYDPTAKRTALKSNGQALTVIDCQFSVRNARAIAIQNNTLNLEGSRFTYCGHAEMSGGAVFHDSNNRTIANCHFDRCLAARGGALYVTTLLGVDKCEFVACESRELQSQNAGNIAVYAAEAGTPTAISRCHFRQTSLAIGSAFNGSNAKFVCSTHFQQANVYFHRKYSSNQIAFDCIFSNGSAIERSFN